MHKDDRINEYREIDSIKTFIEIVAILQSVKIIIQPTLWIKGSIEDKFNGRRVTSDNFYFVDVRVEWFSIVVNEYFGQN